MEAAERKVATIEGVQERITVASSRWDQSFATLLQTDASIQFNTSFDTVS